MTSCLQSVRRVEMATDDERREVARRLRELSGSMGHAQGFDCLLAEAVRGHEFCETPCDECHRSLAAELADLIDSSEPKVKCVAEVKVDGEQLEKLAHDAAVELTGIDRDALMELAKVLGGMGDRYNEHERYELGTTFKAIASRIREALGVDDA